MIREAATIIATIKVQIERRKSENVGIHKEIAKIKQKPGSRHWSKQWRWGRRREVIKGVAGKSGAQLGVWSCMVS